MNKESEFEDIVERGIFQANTAKYTDRIQRAASRFRDSMRKQLLLLDELTTKAARGEMSEDDRSSLVSVREALSLPFSSDSQFVASDLIAEARQLVSDAESLLLKIKAKSK